jgi:hypothetical protein
MIARTNNPDTARKGSGRGQMPPGTMGLGGQAARSDDQSGTKVAASVEPTCGVPEGSSARPKLLTALVCCAASAAVGIWFAAHAPRCHRSELPGPTIGHVIKIYGC